MQHVTHETRRPVKASASQGGEQRRQTSLWSLWDGSSRHGDYDIRPALTPYQHGAASLLVRRMYARCGYDTRSVGYELNDPNRMTLTAWQADAAVATVTIGRDSASGLMADTLYAEELATMRTSERVLCEVTRLAITPEASSPELLTTLFRTAMFHGMMFFAASDVVIEVNPRHAPYYRRQFGFRQIGELRQCPRVNAPAVLLHQELDDISVSGQEVVR
ncbi:N-acyl amino acid synthase FeeM domain-containing protein [Propionivibrio limicola]|uniref:N-acyl amino acid synthase FeeM domain-containing protein n=1 Tax=Propionivibrio limicola TaxID=167645 RepID=UPI0012918EB9|nr:N-acetyltransferase [Propionivibrio limicola]